jgi:hypothetical protein
MVMGLVALRIMDRLKMTLLITAKRTRLVMTMITNNTFLLMRRGFNTDLI